MFSSVCVRVCGHSQVCKHSVTVVASIRYPSHRRHVMWAFMSHSLIFLVSISGFWRTNEVGGKKSQKTKQMIQIDYKDKAVQSIRSSLFSSGIHVLSNSLSLVLFRTKQRVTERQILSLRRSPYTILIIHAGLNVA